MTIVARRGGTAALWLSLAVAGVVGLPQLAAAQTPPVAITADAGDLGPGRVFEGNAATFTVRRIGDTSEPLSVAIAIDGKTDEVSPSIIRWNPTGSSDFDTSKSTTSLTFPAGDAGPKTVTVQTVQDGSYEPEERFDVVLSGTYRSNAFEVRAEGGITEEWGDRYVTVQRANPFTITEGESGTLTFRLNQTLPHDMTVMFEVEGSRHRTSTEVVGDGGADMSDHNLAATGTMTISAGTLSTSLQVPTVADNVPEPDEQFVVKVEISHSSFNPKYPPIRFRDGSVFQAVVVTIVDDDRPPVGQRYVYLHGAGTGQVAGTDLDLPSTRVTLTEGEGTTVTVTLAGEAPANDVSIPLTVTGFPAGEVTAGDYDLPAAVTIKGGAKTGSVMLQITDDTEDERNRELLAVEIDDADTSFPSGYIKGDRSRFEVILIDNDATAASLENASRTVLTEAAGAREATFEVRVRPPYTKPAGTPPFSGGRLAEGDPRLNLRYTGSARHGDDYRSPASLSGSRCSVSGDDYVCAATVSVIDDTLYEGGAGTTERIEVRLDGGSVYGNGARATSGWPLVLTIADDDPQPMFSVADVSETEGGTLTFTVERSGALGNDVSVSGTTGDHDTATSPATAGADYTAANQRLRFRKDVASRTFEIQTTDDNIDEQDETFEVMLSSPADNQGLPAPGIVPGMGTAVGTITDDDDPPDSIDLSVSADEIAEDDSAKVITVTATVTGGTTYAEDTTVAVTVGGVGDGAATEGADYEEVEEFAITIPAGEDKATMDFTLTPLDDDIDEDDEAIAVSGSSGSLSVKDALITLKDDDTRGVTVTPAMLELAEVDDGGTPDTEHQKAYTVVLDSEPTATVTVTVSAPAAARVHTGSGSPAASATLTFAAGDWETAQTVTVTAVPDIVDNPMDKRTATITHAVAGGDYDSVTAAPVAVTVTDDDDAPTELALTVDTDAGMDGLQGDVAEGADATTVTVTATITGATRFGTSQTVTVAVGKAGDPAVEGTDYAEVTDLMITIPAGQASASQQFTLTPTADTADEPNETLSVEGTLTGATITPAMITITDDDDPPVLSTDAPEVEEGHSGTKPLTFTVTLTPASGRTVTVDYADALTGTATSGTDYATLTASTLTFSPGDTEKTVAVTVNGDTTDEPDETVVVRLSMPGHATLDGGGSTLDATGTIEDDDDAPTVAVADAMAVDEGDDPSVTADMAFRVTLSAVSGKTVTVPYTLGGTAIGGPDYTVPSPLSVTIAPGQQNATITVPVKGDAVDEPNETVTVTLGVPTHATVSTVEGAGRAH